MHPTNSASARFEHALGRVAILLMCAALGLCFSGCASDRPPDNTNSPKTVSDFVSKPRPNF
jgi:hypothetical protein